MNFLHFTIDPVIAEAAVKSLAMGFAKPIAESGINILGKAGGTILGKAGKLTEAAQNLLFSISRKYIESYTERHGILKVLGMDKPVSLDSVYTQVNCQSETIRLYESIEAQEDAFRNRQFKDNEQPIPGMQVANENQYLLVLGNPGTGKSTFLRKVGLEALKGAGVGVGDYQHSYIPVLIELRKLRSETINLEFLKEKIAEEFKHCGLPEYQECTNKFLEQGKLLIILDGLDEVPTEKMSDITTAIRNLVDTYSHNRFIVSCRIAAYHDFHNFQRFTNVAIADFNDEQIQAFIHKWFESHSQIEWGQQCWEKLNSRDYAATKELTKTPLLLTLICILFRKRGEFPNKRATVYDDALKTLLSEWDASKEITRQQSYKGLDTKCKEIMLAEIAHNNFIKNNLFFNKAK
ncbi:NACHT domain-containing protein [Synechocystis sp. PCC 7509]|uniref:NACHT domain-containing protein n=1 Tax=Synechocystis sp. PCC 7509 TaxID=927677 RepID=UPI0002ABAAC4|nr:NACHT domain-containing protein [Synechocystis sp. PCC 7509]